MFPRKIAKKVQSKYIASAKGTVVNLNCRKKQRASGEKNSTALFLYAIKARIRAEKALDKKLIKTQGGTYEQQQPNQCIKQRKEQAGI